ncbi:MAG: hypothetical protein ACRDQZ_18510 [Mycobacteriales bacterium]
MHDDRQLVEDRIDRVLRERIRPASYPLSVPMDIALWSTPGEPVPVADGLSAKYAPARVGDRWGPPWSTTWLRLTCTVPADWAGREVEALVDLGFDDRMPGFQCEGLVYRQDGSAVKGLHPRNCWVRVASPSAGGEDVLLFVEAAANPIIMGGPPFQPTPLGASETAGTEPLYRIQRVDLAVFDREVW